MANTVTDQFFQIDPAYPPPFGTVLSVYDLPLTDQNSDGDADKYDGDAVNGVDIKSSWPGDTVTINVTGIGDITYVGTTFCLSDGSSYFTPTDGQVLQQGDFVSSTYVTSQGPLYLSSLGPPCFTQGTMIATPSGPRPVEMIQPGDLVETVDVGSAPVRMVHKRQLGEKHLRSNPRHKPIVIPRGALGREMPNRDLCLSPQHRVLIASKIARRMYGEHELLLPAACLLGYFGVERDERCTSIDYYHLVFDTHSIVWANGALTESLYLGRNAVSDLSRSEFNELREVVGVDNALNVSRARPFASGSRAKSLVRRHSLNGKFLVSSQALPSVRDFDNMRQPPI